MSLPRVLVIDAGLGNIGSVLSALNRHACSAIRVKKPPSFEDTATYTHALLPGVGSFEAGMQALRALGWDSWIKHVWFVSDRPFLGVCLGMQLLASEGTEGSSGLDVVAGLDLIPGRVALLSCDPDLVLPHVGWNSLHWGIPENPLGCGLPQGGDVYFVHSYAFRPIDPTHALAFANYGDRFAAVVARGSCYGVQFHPEKSQRLGHRLLANFLALPPC